MSWRKKPKMKMSADVAIEWNKGRTGTELSAQQRQYRMPCVFGSTLHDNPRLSREVNNHRTSIVAAFRSYLRQSHVIVMATETHECTAACSWWVFGDSRVCADTGNVHHCTSITCDKLVVSACARVCQLTGIIYPPELQLFERERREDGESEDGSEEENKHEKEAKTEIDNAQWAIGTWEPKPSEAIVITTTQGRRKRGRPPTSTPSSSGHRKPHAPTGHAPQAYTPPEKLIKQASEVASRWWNLSVPNRSTLRDIGCLCARLWKLFHEECPTSGGRTRSNKYDYIIHCRTILQIMGKGGMKANDSVTVIIPHFPMVSMPMVDPHAHKGGTLTAPTRILRAALEQIPTAVFQ